jgi:hypothetical protein
VIFSRADDPVKLRFKDALSTKPTMQGALFGGIR